MAFETGEANNQAAGNKEQKTTQQAQPTTGGLNVLRQFSMQSVSQSPGIEEKLKHFFDEGELQMTAFLSKNNGYNGGTMPITDGLALPVLVVYTESEDKIYAYCLLLEEFADRTMMKSDTLEINGRRIELEKPNTIYYSDTLRSAASAILHQTLKCNKSVCHVGHTCVAESADLTNPSICRTYIETATYACAEAMQINPDLSAKIITQNGLEVANVLDLSPAAGTRDAYGTPIASDFTAKLVIREPIKQARRNDVVDPHERRDEMIQAQANGILDIINVAPQQTLTPSGQPIYPAYMKNIIITNTSTLGAQNTLSRENLLSQLMAVASVANLAQDMQALQVLNYTGTRKGDIGNLAGEYDPTTRAPSNGKMIKTVPYGPSTASDPKAMTPYRIAETFLIKGVLISLDIQMGGPLYWIQKFFMHAADTSNPAEADKYNTAIIAKLDEFTDGKFSTLWTQKGGTQVMIPGINYRHSGTYQDERGVTRDVRDIDRLKLLEILKGDPETMKLYNRYSCPGNSAIPETYSTEAMHDMREVLNGMFSGTYKSTGYVARVSFSPVFLGTLIEALAACGMRFSMEGSFKNHQNSHQDIYFNADRFSSLTMPHDIYMQNGGFSNTNAFARYF